MEGGQTVIEFKNVSKVYQSGDKQVTAVDNISMLVPEGQICVLLGSSGSGKTTLLRMVNRLISITSGSIHLGGKDISQINEIELRRTCGYAIQQVGLFPNMTIEQNIAVVPKMLGWDRVTIKKRYDELMDMMGLNPDEYRKRYPWELSGGQQQRIGVARALAADPPVMLMDEPFGALDPIIRERIQSEFLRIQQHIRKTILFVIHDIDEAVRLGDSIAIFQAGRLIQYASPDEMLSSPQNEFVSEFVGTDRALKRLSLLTVGDLVRKQGGFKNVLLINKEMTKEAVQLDTNLRTALSIVLAAETGEVIVIDEKQKPMGMLRIEDFQEILAEIEPISIASDAR